MDCQRLIEKSQTLRYRMTRKKAIASHDTKTSLNRYLTTCHLTFMGVGGTVGVGIYVLVGVAAKEYAGPGMLISFVLAGIVTLLNAICFAEFGARIPKTGVAYTYVYDSLCEILAFIVGWFMLLGYLSGGAIVCRAWSGYFDSLFDGAIHNLTTNYLGTIQFGPPFSNSYDVTACLFQLVAVLIVSLGIQASAKVNFLLSCVSICVLLFVTVMGFVFGNINNILNKDHGGFLPFGVSGVIVGTSACFYAFQGFDVICMSAEESKTPHKSIPRAITFSLIIVTLIYAGSSFSLLLLCPVQQIDVKAPLPSAFDLNGIKWAKYIVTIGPVLGIGNLVLINLFSTSRHLYCMANDGLFFRVFAFVNEKTKIPLTAVVIVGLINAVGALLLDMANMVQFNVIAMFLINIIISANIIIVRARSSFRDEDISRKSFRMKAKSEMGILQRIANSLSVEFLTFSLVVIAFPVGLLVEKSLAVTSQLNILALCAVVFLVGLMLGLCVIIKKSIVRHHYDGYQIPFVPFLPALIILINSMLLLYATDFNGLISLCILTVIGFLVYLLMIFFSADAAKQSEVKSEENVPMLEDSL